MIKEIISVNLCRKRGHLSPYMVFMYNSLN
jgi:hypothetical protein